MSRREVQRKRSVLALGGAIAMVIGAISFIGAAGRARDDAQLSMRDEAIALTTQPAQQHELPAPSQAVVDEVVEPAPAPPVQTKVAQAPPKASPKKTASTPRSADPGKIIDALLAGSRKPDPKLGY
jgi:hypothetical protein